MNKFRVWCENKQEWEAGEVYLDQRGILWQETRYAKIRLPKTHIVEFETGIHDKNGKDIYCGDIVLYDDSHRDKFKVEFKDGRFVIIGEDAHCWTFNMRYIDEYEVVGNIHENPELIK